jgi:hypothetical protein
MRIINIICIVATSLALAAPIGAEEEKRPSPSSGFASGFFLQKHQNDFGFGGQIVTPTFARDRLAIAATGSYNYVPGSQWAGYGAASLSLLAGLTAPSETHRLYGISGVVLLIPSEEVSAEDVVIGAIGGFGFEFFFSEDHAGAYYLEFGGIGTAAVADALPGSPVYANGFVSRVGIRYYLD